MALGTKNRQRQTAEACKRHLRVRPPEELPLVEEFIREVENRASDDEEGIFATWSARFVDAKRSEREMLERVDAAFEEWMRPDGR